LNYDVWISTNTWFQTIAVFRHVIACKSHSETYTPIAPTARGIRSQLIDFFTLSLFNYFIKRSNFRKYRTAANDEWQIFVSLSFNTNLNKYEVSLSQIGGISSKRRQYECIHWQVNRIKTALSWFIVFHFYIFIYLSIYIYTMSSSVAVNETIPSANGKEQRWAHCRLEIDFQSICNPNVFGFSEHEDMLSIYRFFFFSK
jgi:hypothetical protein